MRNGTQIKIDFWLIGILLVGFITYQFCISTLLFFVGISIENWNCWFIIISYILLSWAYLKNWYSSTITLKKWTQVYLWATTCVLISLLISSYFIDYSYDGQSYHGEAIIELYKGWNPTKEYLPYTNFINLVINHFAKASWVNGAFFYKLTGVFECAKASNLILAFATFFIAFPFFEKWFKKSISVVLALLLALNPIVLNIYLSNMLDGQVASLTFIFFILIYQFFGEKNKLALLTSCFTMIYILNLKFTLVGYFVIYLFALFVYLFIKKRLVQNIRPFIFLSIAFVLGFLFFGYNPYVKNTISHDHPFYPFKGTNAVDSAIVQAKDYASGSRLINFVKSNFASSTYSEAYNKPIHYKLPLKVTKYELERYAFAGVMIGGFGVWYSAILIFSICLYLFVAIKHPKQIFKNDFLFYYLPIVILATILINPLGYIARYIPQFYIIPFLALILFHKYYTTKWVVNSLLFLMIINSFLVCGYTYYNFVVTRKLRQQMKELVQLQKPIEVNLGQHYSKTALFDAYHINYKTVKTFTNQSIVPDTLFRSEVTYEVVQ